MLHAPPGFQRFPTHHCVTGSLRHLYEFHGYAISEELLLGLGAGLGFVYWHMKGNDPLYGGRANVGRPGEEGLERTAGRRTGVRAQSLNTGSAQRAERALLEQLGAGKPVMLQVDMGFLPYFDFPPDFHFGGHVIVVAACDPETRQALVVDHDEDFHAVSLLDLARARGSEYKPFPPRHTWFTFDFREKRPPEPLEVRQAIGDVVSGMLAPPIANLGVKGIRKAAAQTLKWPHLMDEKQLRHACLVTDIFIDAKGGTGGGIFRYMYGRFLVEAADILGEAKLVEVAEEMREIGDCWQQVAAIFREANAVPHPAKLLPDAAEALTLIADREDEIWARLKEIAGA